MGNLEDKVLAAGLVPERLLRRVIASRVKGLERTFNRLSQQELAAREASLFTELESGPLTLRPDEANRQHYDLPPDFFAAIVGPRLKYSCCYWDPGVRSLAQAEEAMLELTASRAELEDGQEVLDRGCGWGALCLWAAERFPNSRIVAVSNSAKQREFIERRREEKGLRDPGLRNLEVITAEVGDLSLQQKFDRVVSVEVFEHVRNHRALLERIAGWLKPEGKLFVHLFCHRRLLYTFEPDGSGSWMARHFFAGGIMPSWDYLLRYQDALELLARWQIDGLH